MSIKYNQETYKKERSYQELKAENERLRKAIKEAKDDISCGFNMNAFIVLEKVLGEASSQEGSKEARK